MQCSCRGLPVMSVVVYVRNIVCGMQKLQTVAICLNGKATDCIELVKLFDSCFYKKCGGVLYFE